MTIKHLRMTKMSPIAWANMAENPRQRNTEEHARFAQKRHLSKPHPMHEHVNAAVLPDGTSYKVDGHTRSFLWQDGILPSPPQLSVTWWECDTINDVKDLYYTFDNRKAAETSRDDAYGVLRDCGINFQSKMLQKRQFLSGLKLAWTVCVGTNLTGDTEDIERGIKFFARELEMFDTLDPQPKTFNHGLIAAALITLKTYGISALTFWDNYQKDNGWKQDGRCDPIEALARLVREMRAEKRYGQSHMQDLAQRALSCFERWRDGDTYFMHSKGGVAINKTTRFAPYRKNQQTNFLSVAS